MLQPRPVQQRRVAGAPVQRDAAPAGTPDAAAPQQDLTPLFDKLAGAYFPGTQANARAFIATQSPEVRPALEERLTQYIAEWTGADARTRARLKLEWKGHHAKYAGAPAPEAATEGAMTPQVAPAAEPEAQPAAIEPAVAGSPREQVESMIAALEKTHATNAAKGKKVEKGAKKGYWNGNIRAALLKGKQLENLVEYSPEQAAQVAHAIGDCRQRIEQLGAADLGIAIAGGDAGGKAEAAAVREARGRYHRQLNRVEPYFTQMVNASILGDKGHNTNDKGEVTKEWSEETWKGTCNLTAVASALMARGKAPRDFVGGAGKDAALLARVAATLDPKSFSDPEAMYALRMPDFIQLVYILNKLSGASSDPKAFKAAVLTSQKTCRSTTTNLVVHNGVVAMFGVKQLEFSTKLNANEKAFKKKGKFDLETYVTKAKQEFVPRLNKGEQVTINKPGHIVRLVDVTDKGIMIDDSAYEGAKFEMDWAKCAAENYFRAHAIYF